MKEDQFEEYVQLKKEEELLSEKIKEIESKADPLREEKKKIANKREILGDNLIEKMKSTKIKTYDLNGVNITLASRETVKIVDHDLAIKSILSKGIWNKIKGIAKLTSKQFEEQAVITTKTLIKDKVMPLYEYAKGVEGIEIEGFEVQKTEYLTVK